MKDKDIKLRIRTYIKSRHETLAQICKRIDLKPEYLSSVLTGMQGVSAQIYKALSKTELSIDWALTGEGNMIKGTVLSKANLAGEEIYKDWLRDKDSLIELLKSENDILKQNVGERRNIPRSKPPTMDRKVS